MHSVRVICPLLLDRKRFRGNSIHHLHPEIRHHVALYCEYILLLQSEHADTGLNLLRSCMHATLR